MSIRTKLVGAFLLVALFVPVVGLLVGRVAAGNDSGGDTTAASVARQLAESQRAQQAALLTYVNGGDVQAREQYVTKSLGFQDAISGLAGTLSGSDSEAELQAIADERGRFGTTAEDAIFAREYTDRGLTDLRAAEGTIVQELNAIRGRVAGPSGDIAAVPAAQRAQAAELLRNVESMNQAVDQQAALAAGYTIQQQEATRRQVEAVGATFNSALQRANAAAGPEDRAALGRAEAAYRSAFVPNTETLMNAADSATRARTALATSSDTIVGHLNTLAEQTGSTTAGGGSGNTGLLTLAVSLIAFLLAAGLGFWFAASITRPLRQLRDAAELVSTGVVDGVEIGVNTHDEVGELANAFRRMVTSTRFLLMDKAEREAEDRDFMSTSIST